MARTTAYKKWSRAYLGAKRSDHITKQARKGGTIRNRLATDLRIKRKSFK